MIGLKVDNIYELTSTVGTTIESILCKDGHIEITPTDASDNIYLSNNTSNYSTISIDKSATPYYSRIMYKDGGSPTFTTGLLSDNNYTIYNEDLSIRTIEIEFATNIVLINDTLNVDIINEFNLDSGVTVDGLKIENGTVPQFSDSGDPSGFVTTTQTSAFVNGSRQFTITPSGTFSYYSDGIKYTKNAPENIVIDDLEGLHVIYYDGATLSKNNTPTTSELRVIVASKCIVAYIYWDFTNKIQLYFTENSEYHGISMSGMTHWYLHNTYGARWLSGMSLNTIDADQSGDVNSHAQFGVELGSMSDEDLYNSTSAVVSTVGLPIYYLEGATPVWRRKINTGYSVRSYLDDGVTYRLAYNQFTGGSWQQTEISNLDFVLYHVFAINDSTYDYISVQGQNIYLTRGQARQGALVEINNLVTIGLVGQEMIPIATLIFQTSNGYSNAVKARVRTTDTGDDYVDWRFQASQGIGAISNSHGLLTDLGNDDHTQYALLDGRATDILKIDQIDEFSSGVGVTIESILVKDGHLEITPTDTSDGIYLSANTNDDTIFNMDKPAIGDDCKILYKTGGSPLFTTGLIGNNSFTIYNDTTTSNSLTIDTATNLISILNTLAVDTITEYGSSGVDIMDINIEDAVLSAVDICLKTTSATGTICMKDDLDASVFTYSNTADTFIFSDSLSITIGNSLKTNTINTYNALSGVTIEGIELDANDIRMSGTLDVDTINENGSGVGVTIESVIIKDGMIDINPTGATAGLNIRGNTGGNATIEMFKDATADSINITLYDASTSLKFRMDLDTSNDFNIYNHAQTSNIITLPTASDFLVLPTTYANTVTTSVRNLFIDSNGLVGGISSVLASKININNIINTDFIDDIQIKTYNYRKRDKNKKYTEEAENEIQIGIIADTLESLVSSKSNMHKDLLTYDKIKDHTDECNLIDWSYKNRECKCPTHDKLASVNYYKFIPLLIKYVQDLKIRLNNLEKV